MALLLHQDVGRLEDSSENGGSETSRDGLSSYPLSCGNDSRTSLHVERPGVPACLGDDAFDVFQVGDGSRKLLQGTGVDVLACFGDDVLGLEPGAAETSKFWIQGALEIEVSMPIFGR